MREVAGRAGDNADLGWGTLDESIWKTLRRDVDRVVTNVKGVLWPFGRGGRASH